MIYICNAFSLAMISQFKDVKIRCRKITVEEVRDILSQGFHSSLGHETTGKIISDMIGINIPVNRDKTVLQPGDLLIVTQYLGPRLPEGAVTLPPGAVIEFFAVTLEEASND